MNLKSIEIKFIELSNWCLLTTLPALTIFTVPYQIMGLNFSQSEIFAQKSQFVISTSQLLSEGNDYRVVSIVPSIGMLGLQIPNVNELSFGVRLPEKIVGRDARVKGLRSNDGDFTTRDHEALIDSSLKVVGKIDNEPIEDNASEPITAPTAPKSFSIKVSN